LGTVFFYTSLLKRKKSVLLTCYGMPMKKQNLYNDYLLRNTTVSSFFGRPLTPEWPVLSKQITGLPQHPQFIQQVVRQNRNRDDKAVRANLKKMTEKPPVFVVTGQQPGLFVSPLYIIYKTLTAIRLAETLQKRLPDYCVLPLFWLEGEDHDYTEVASLRLWGTDNVLHSFTLPEEKGQHGFSMSRRKLPGQIVLMLNEIKSTLPQTKFGDELFSALNEIYLPGRLWLDAFAGQMHLIFRNSGLLLFNPGDIEIKKISVPFFERLIVDNTDLVQAYFLQSQRLKDAGYPLQVHLRGNLAYIYLCDQEGRRKHVYREGEGFILAGKEKKWEKSELIRYLYDRPDRFSSTVLTRPLWQSWMLPVISYVAGPAEIAYWAMLKEAFTLFDIPMPQLQPRASFILVEPAIRRLLQKLALDVDTITQEKQSFIRQKFKEQADSAAIQSLHSLKLGMEKEKNELLKAIPQIDDTLSSIVHKTFGRINKNIHTLESKILKRLEDKQQRLTARLARIHEHFYPLGKKQERIIGSIYFFNKYGYEWISELKEKIDVENPHSQTYDL